MKFRKKPVIIEAIQWIGCNFQEVSDFIRISGDTDATLPKDNKDIAIITLEDGAEDSWTAQHVASVGDWIIRGIKNELYPCKPDIFEATYDLVPESGE